MVIQGDILQEPGGEVLRDELPDPVALAGALHLEQLLRLPADGRVGQRPGPAHQAGAV